jgi:hypothetical protein
MTRLSKLAFNLDSIPNLCVKQNRKTLTLSFGDDGDKLYAGWNDTRKSYFLRYVPEPNKPIKSEDIKRIFAALPFADERPALSTAESAAKAITIYIGNDVASVNADCRKLCALLQPISLENSLPHIQANAEKRTAQDFFMQTATMVIFCVEKRLYYPLKNWRQAFCYDLVDDLISIGSTQEAFDSAAYREHVVPLCLVHRHCSAMAEQGAKVRDIASFLEANLLLVNISSKQAKHLNAAPLGPGGMLLKESMPDNWKWGDDPVDRLKAAGINISPNRPIKRWEPWSPSTRKAVIRSRVRRALIKRIF